MSIVVSGDLHGQHDYHTITNSNVKRTFEKAEKSYPPAYHIVAGDWGAIWNDSDKGLAQEQYLINWYNQKAWETVVVLGNHEGYSRIHRLPVVERFGGPVWKVSDKIHILQNGHVYTIEGKTFFIYGGAESIDKAHRQPFVSWWPEEIPSYQDFMRAMTSLGEVGGKVDYVITHTCPNNVLDYMVEKHLLYSGEKLADPVVPQLDGVQAAVTDYKKRFFGHFHVDFEFEKYQCLYEKLFIID